jgi:hypothetical protein
MFEHFSFGKADALLGSTFLAGLMSLIPGIKEALQILLLVVGICSGIASAYYYVVAARKIK